MSRLKKVWNLFFETGKSWGKDHAGFLAAGLSYFTVFSIAPLLLLAIALAGKLFGPAAAEGLVAEQLGGLVGPKVGEGIQSILSNAQKSGAGAASIMGGILLLFAASRLFTQLRIALNMIWNVAPKKEKLTFRRSVWRLLHKRLLAFAMVLCVGACLALFFLVDAGLGVIWNIFGERLLPEFLGVHFLKVLNLGVSLIPLTFLTAVIYRYLPDTRIGWRDVWVGAFVTALFIAIGRFLIGLYFEYTDVGSVYGVAGTIVVVFVGIYLSAMVFLFGAEFTWVYAHREGTRARPGALPEKKNVIPNEDRQEPRSREHAKSR